MKVFSGKELDKQERISSYFPKKFKEYSEKNLIKRHLRKLIISGGVFLSISCRKPMPGYQKPGR